MRTMVTDLYMTCIGNTHSDKPLPLLPHDPVSIFSQRDIDEIGVSKHRIFFSYFTSSDVTLDVEIDFEPISEFDFLLVGIYYLKNGLDRQMCNLLQRRPELYLFTRKDFFVALYAPHLPEQKHRSVNFDETSPSIVYVDGEQYHAFNVAHMFHHSPFLRDITYHIGEHARFFMEDL